MATAKLLKVWFTIIDTDGEGPAGDGTVIVRFAGKKAQKACEDFAAKHTYYGRPATASMQESPRHVAERWRITWCD